MASNYDCGTCPCPYNYTPSLNYGYPDSMDVAINALGTFEFFAGYEDCNGVEYWYNYSDEATWSSGNYNIALAEYYGTVKGVSARHHLVFCVLYRQHLYFQRQSLYGNRCAGRRQWAGNCAADTIPQRLFQHLWDAAMHGGRL